MKLLSIKKLVPHVLTNQNWGIMLLANQMKYCQSRFFPRLAPGICFPALPHLQVFTSAISRTVNELSFFRNNIKHNRYFFLSPLHFPTAKWIPIFLLNFWICTIVLKLCIVTFRHKRYHPKWLFQDTQNVAPFSCYLTICLLGLVQKTVEGERSISHPSQNVPNTFFVCVNRLQIHSSQINFQEKRGR